MARPRPQLPWDPVDLTPSEIASIKALSDGQAEPEQQRIAWRTIVEKVCGVDAMSFTVLGSIDGQRATDFAEGKRWVGKTLRTQIAGREYPVNPRGAPPPMPEAPPADQPSAEASKPGET